MEGTLLEELEEVDDRRDQGIVEEVILSHISRRLSPLSYTALPMQEISLFYDMPRSATVACREHTECVMVNREVLRQICPDNMKRQATLKLDTIRYTAYVYMCMCVLVCLYT